MYYQPLTDMVCWTIVAFPTSKNLIGRTSWDSQWVISKPLKSIVYDQGYPKIVVTEDGDLINVIHGPSHLDLDGISFLCNIMDDRGLTTKEKNNILISLGSRPLFAE